MSIFYFISSVLLSLSNVNAKELCKHDILIGHFIQSENFWYFMVNQGSNSEVKYLYHGSTQQILSKMWPHWPAGLQHLPLEINAHICLENSSPYLGRMENITDYQLVDFEPYQKYIR